MKHNITYTSTPLTIECVKTIRAKKMSYQKAMFHATSPKNNSSQQFKNITLQLTLDKNALTTQIMTKSIWPFIQATCKTLIIQANDTQEQNQFHLKLKQPNQQNNQAAYGELTAIIRHIRKHITLDAKDSDTLNTFMLDIFSQKNSKNIQRGNTAFQGGNLAR